jgi:regulator of protease activity HflC (stomatin/prohibitin superfamily)
VQVLVLPGIGSLTREVIAEYTAEQVYSTARQEIQDKIRSLVEERLSQKMMEHAGEEGEESYRVSMSSVLILYDILVTGIELPAPIVAAINRKIEQYLRWRGVEATLQLSQSTNAKRVIIGNGKDGHSWQ